MFGSNILEVAIGIIFIFILVSVLCTAIREGIEGWLKTRAAYLEHGIRELLMDKEGDGIAKSFFNHPLIYSLYTDTYKPGKATGRPALLARGGSLPSYIPSKNFALALMDIAARGPATDEVSSDANSPVISLESIRFNIANIGNPGVQRVLLGALDTAQGDLNKFQSSLESWYDSSMDRVSGWYKRSTQWILFWISLTVAVGLNINIVTIANYFSQNDTARKIVVERAAAMAADSSFTGQSYNEAKTNLDSLRLPIGWAAGWGAPVPGGNTDSVWNMLFGPLLGWFCTALAAILGAPFWFDVLNKMMVIRSTVKPHEKSKEEASEDRQLPKSQQFAVESPGSLQKGENTRSPQKDPFSSSFRGFSPSPADPTTVIDGCDVLVSNLTEDEDLPASEGGVA